MELGAPGSLDAVVGPEGLRSVGQFDLVVGVLAWMGRGEGCVVGCMPVLGEDDVRKMRSDVVNWGENCIAVRNGQRAARAEVVLYVDDEEDVVGSDFHLLFRLLVFAGRRVHRYKQPEDCAGVASAANGDFGLVLIQDPLRYP